MKKFKLDAEELRVETFSTDGLEKLEGTVYGNDATRPASGCASCQSCAGDCSSFPNYCFCTELGNTCNCA